MPLQKSEKYFTLTVKDGLISAASTAEILIVDSQVTVTQVLGQAIQAINIVNPGNFKNDNQKNTMTKKTAVVIGMIESAIANVNTGLLAEALGKLEDDVMKKTDGCANTGKPDNNDWIKDCADQDRIYPIVLDAVNKLKAMM